MLDAIVLTVVICVYVLLAIVVITNNPNTRLNRLFTALLLTIPAWCTVVFLEDAWPSYNYVNALARVDYALASCMLALFYWFCVTLAQRNWYRLNFVVTTLATASVAIALIGFTTHTVIEHGDTVVLQPTPVGYAVFILLLLTSLSGGLFGMLRKFLTSSGRERSQVVFVGAGLLLSAFIVTMSLIVAPRVFELSGSYITRFGLYGTLCFAGFSTYAVVRHKFMDIRRAVARSLTYALVLITLTTLYIGMAFGIVRVFFDEQQLNLSQTYTFTISAVVLAFTHQPLKRFFDRVTDRIFYRHGYNTQSILNEIGDVASNQIELASVAHQAMKILQNALKSEFVSTHILPTNSEHPPYKFHVGKLPQNLQAAIPHLNELKEEITIIDQLDSGSSLRNEINSIGIHVIVRLQTSHELLGYLLFGAKQNGTLYDTRDTQLLSTVGDELALAIQNSLRFKEIHDFNETLQTKVNDATAELLRTNKKLHALDESKDEFISMASHQLRTPLTTVKGYLSMVLEGDTGKITSEQRRVLEEAFSGAQRMVYLISDFLNVSRLQTGKFELEIRPANLNDILVQEITHLQDSAASRHLTIQYDPSPNFPTIPIDENKIRQVIMNFIDNAVYYSKQGETIRVTLSQQGKEAIFKVIDRGIGVPANERHKLFSKFFRATNAKKQRPDGTGIGLFMSRKVVVAHGGSIIFESKENQGSTFGFRLPLKNNLNQLNNNKDND